MVKGILKYQMLSHTGAMMSMGKGEAQRSQLNRIRVSKHCRRLGRGVLVQVLHGNVREHHRQ